MFNLENEINYPYINHFLAERFKRVDPLFCEMEGYAQSTHIPIVQPETARLLETLCLLTKPKRILEVGTAIGYSSIIMAKAIGSYGMVDTIELNDDMIQKARYYIQKAGMDKNIRTLQGDANDVLQCLGTPYDFVFLDAAKGQYPEFLPHCLRLLNQGGILVSDNILYKGLVAKPGLPNPKHRTITVRLRQYLDELCERENLVTSIIPIGDGVTISVKTIMGDR